MDTPTTPGYSKLPASVLNTDNIILELKLKICKQVPKEFLNLTQTPKIAPKDPKSVKRPKIWPNLKQKDMALLPKLNLVVYIIRPKVQVQFDVLISSFNFKFQFQVSISSFNFKFNFKFQFQDSISSFNFEFQF